MTGAALALRAPVLRTGFLVDDYAQLSMMQGTFPVQRSPLELFTFAKGNRADNEPLRASGYLPWWSASGLRVALFRPLSSALMWVDRALFEKNAGLYHVHSAAWWVAMSIMWGVLLRRLLPAGAALLVIALMLLHPAHAMLLGWIANRNATIATLFCLIGLWAQLRGREGAWRLGTAVALLSYGCALAAGEYALGFLMFGLAYEWTGIGSGGMPRRWVRMAGLLGLVVGYAALRSALGFGARASGMYIDPAAEPLAYASAASTRFPVLVSDLVLGLRSNWWSGGYPWAAALVQRTGVSTVWALDLHRAHDVHVLAGVIALMIGTSVAWLAQRDATHLRFVALALPLSLAPALGSLPESRLLLPALFGWLLLLASFTTRALVRLRANVTTRNVLGAAFAIALVLLEGSRSFVYSSQDVAFLPRFADAIRRSILAPELDPLLGRAKHALLLSATDPTTTIYIPLVRRWHGRPGPERCHLLLSTLSPLRLQRLDARSFSLERLDANYTSTDIYGQTFNREPIATGQRFTVDGLQVVVQRAFLGFPMLVRYEVEENLDDPSVVLLMQTTAGLLPIAFPPIGTSLSLPAASLPLDLMQP